MLNFEKTHLKELQGANDTQGALNRITNETILAAGKEIQIGRAINLKYDLSIPQNI
jgi:hypothetical protein